MEEGFLAQKVAVLGAGSWGSALAKLLCENGHDVTLWGNSPAEIDAINETHRNERYLKGVVLPEQLKATLDLKKAMDGADALVFVVPTRAMRVVAQQVNSLLEGQPVIVHAGKGLEQGTDERISQILAEELKTIPQEDIVVLSGPSHAEEVAREDLTTITSASLNQEKAVYVQKLFMSPYFRVYTNNDVIGVELGAALKNIIAVGAGILHGLGYGDNAKAALMTRGLVEMKRFGLAFGAQAETFSGLSGVGDLIVTCTSVHSRNWQCGHLIGQGLSLQEALDQVNMAVEGVWTTRVVYDISRAKGIDMPITESLYDVLYKGVDPKDAVIKLMLRDGKSEHQGNEKRLENAND